MTIGVYAAPDLARPTVAEVFVHAAARIHRAAAEIWPGDPVFLDQHVPSVTGYVHRVRVADRTLYAKTSFLGISLVSLLRGTRGSWAVVRQAQQDYEQRPDGLLAREAAQLRALAGLGGPQVCSVVGMRSGVIFTEAVPGPTLTELLLDRPGQTGELLERPLLELQPLHRPGAARRLEPAGVMEERSIAGTFLRKFDGAASAQYVEQLGVERVERLTREQVVELVRVSVRRLHGLRMTLPSVPGTTLAYGDLKPEHVVFPEGPDGRPVLLDPGLLQASPMIDVAKLLSRTVLFLVAHRPDPVTVRQILDGLAVLAVARAGHLSAKERRAWVRHLLTLWLMDTLNITTTYLSAPAGLPLPTLGQALVERADRVCCLVDVVSADLHNPGARGLGDRTLDRIAEVAA
ncbi:hypothetical protein ACIOHS_27470 [Streptomyces sp. NPDC088253]|uniref:hypothetical protein n=1 Tax=Streptomyces sp. NPDC088253 TaxID=3365846 RepID=UPI0038126A88